MRWCGHVRCQGALLVNPERVSPEHVNLQLYIDASSHAHAHTNACKLARQRTRTFSHTRNPTTLVYG
eukprot:5508128-Pleurochrysis_carterae.AAC.2